MKFFFLILVFLSGEKLFSQLDSIIFVNGAKATINLLAEYPNYITYTIYNDTSKTVFKIKKTEIKKLYLNSSNTSNTSKQTVKQKSNNQHQILSKNIHENILLDKFSSNFIGFNMTQVLFTTLSINYQHIFANGVLGFKVYGGQNLEPKDLKVSVNEIEKTISYNFFNTLLPVSRRTTIGLDLNYFPFNQRKVTYFVGPSLQVGIFNAYSLTNIQTQINPPFPQQPYYTSSVIKSTIKDVKNISLIINNGFLFRASPYFFAECSAGFGIQQLNFGAYGQIICARASLQINVGYSF